MSGERLREAATLMRERAMYALVGPWQDSGGMVIANVVDGNYGPAQICHPLRKSDATHIASWHPAVALAVADWLDGAAKDFAYAAHLRPDRAAALAVADAYLGSAQ